MQSNSEIFLSLKKLSPFAIAQIQTCRLLLGEASLINFRFQFGANDGNKSGWYNNSRRVLHRIETTTDSEPFITEGCLSQYHNYAASFQILTVSVSHCLTTYA